MKNPVRLLLLTTSLLLLSGCHWLSSVDHPPQMRLETGGPEINSDSIMNEIDNSFLPGIDDDSRKLGIDQILEMSDRDIKNLRNTTVPVFKTHTLKTILFPTARATQVEAHQTPFGYCASDYLAGVMLTIDLEWVRSQRDDCRPSGRFDFEEVSAKDLIKWRNEWQIGPPIPQDSIMNELGS